MIGNGYSYYLLIYNIIEIILSNKFDLSDTQIMMLLYSIQYKLYKSFETNESFLRHSTYYIKILDIKYVQVLFMDTYTLYIQVKYKIYSNTVRGKYMPV